jgi:hypothetical protein
LVQNFCEASPSLSLKLFSPKAQPTTPVCVPSYRRQNEKRTLSRSQANVASLGGEETEPALAIPLPPVLLRLPCKLTPALLRHAHDPTLTSALARWLGVAAAQKHYRRPSPAIKPPTPPHSPPHTTPLLPTLPQARERCLSSPRRARERESRSSLRGIEMVSALSPLNRTSFLSKNTSISPS